MWVQSTTGKVILLLEDFLDLFLCGRDRDPFDEKLISNEIRGNQKQIIDIVSHQNATIFKSGWEFRFDTIFLSLVGASVLNNVCSLIQTQHIFNQSFLLIQDSDQGTTPFGVKLELYLNLDDFEIVKTQGIQHKAS